MVNRRGLEPTTYRVQSDDEGCVGVEENDDRRYPSD